MIRLSLEMTPKMRAVLDDMERDLGLSVPQILRRGIAILKTLEMARAKGLEPALIDAAGSVKARLTGIFEENQ